MTRALPPSRRTVRVVESGIPALEAAEAAYPVHGLPGESWEAFLRRTLSPALWTALVALRGGLLRASEPPPPRQNVMADPGRSGQNATERKRRTERARATRLAADRAAMEERRELVLRLIGGRGLSANAAARFLTERGIPAPRGGGWQAAQVLRCVTPAGPSQASRRAVSARPGATARQVAQAR
jgi:hypothetical protein